MDLDARIPVALVTLAVVLTLRGVSRRAGAGAWHPFHGTLLLLGTSLVCGGLHALRYIPPGLRETMHLVSAVALTLAVVRVLWVALVGGVLRNGSVLGISKITHDIAQASVTLVAAVAAARAAGADPRTLATTGGLVTAGLTFSLQQTLGDLVAGLLLQGQHPFGVGDWIAYDDNPAHIGKVVEINWRATKVVTLDRVEVTVPNSLLAKASIVNFHAPAMAARRSVYFHVGLDVAPTVVQATVLDAVKGADGVLDQPAPSCALADFDESGARYWLRFFLDDQERRDLIDSGVRVRVWFALRRAGIAIALPRRDVEVRQDSHVARAEAARSEEDRRRQALTAVDFLQPMGSEAIADLAARARTVHFTRGETVVEQGSTGTELYVVAEGSLAVVLGQDEVARLGRGEFFGEMALLTGEPRAATVRAVTEAVLYVIDRGTFERVIAPQRDALDGVSRMLARRMAELEARKGHGPVSAEAEEARVNSLVQRMSRLFFG